jgi:4-carboxymuconolactone decarboxylase
MSARFREFARDALSPEQQSVFDAVAAHRGSVPTPFHILLESPELASLTQNLGAFCRYRTGFPAHLSELLVLVTAAHWDARYELAVHEPEARKAGIPQSVIEAVKSGARPAFADRESKLVYEFATAFYATRDVPDEIFDAAVATFGRKRVVEMAVVLGYYSLLAILLAIYRVPGGSGRD